MPALCFICKEKPRRFGGSYCNPCASAYVRDLRHKQDPRVRRAAQIKYRYKITLEQYDALYEAQGGRCAVCDGLDDGSFVIDHDHACCSTNKKTCGSCIRGLVHGRCNKAIAVLGDAVPGLARALAYVLDPPAKRAL